MMPGVFSGKPLKGNNPNKEGVSYGPLAIPKIQHQMDLVISKTIGRVPVTPAGAMQPDPAKAVYLKS